MRILFIGDIIGKPGRDVVGAELPRLRDVLKLDFAIANGENAAGGFGLTRATANDLFGAGVDCITTGNHWADQKEILSFISDEDRILRPKNYPAGTPGKGANLFVAREGQRILVVNVMGRVFMDPLDDPFAAVEAELAACPLGEGADAIVVDMHAEATSEKVGMGWYLDGRATAVVGTHTHVPTADARILPGGTAYITDVGMTGPRGGVIGVKRELAIEAMTTKMPIRFEVSTEDPWLQGVLITASDQPLRATAIEQILEPAPGIV